MCAEKCAEHIFSGTAKTQVGQLLGCRGRSGHWHQGLRVVGPSDTRSNTDRGPARKESFGESLGGTRGQSLRYL